MFLSIRFIVKWTINALLNRHPDWWKEYSKSAASLSSASNTKGPSGYWALLGNRFLKLLYVFGLNSCRDERIYGDFVSWPDAVKNSGWLFYQHVQRKDYLGLLLKLEEPECFKTDVTLIDGRRMTLGLLSAIDEFYSVFPEVERGEGEEEKEKRIIVSEIGSGYGRTAHVFLKANPHLTYLIVDLPESLVISQHYLSTILRGESMLFHQDSKKTTRFDRSFLHSYRVVFMTPDQLSLLEDQSVDIFMGINSFQEMPLKTIESYFQTIEEKSAGYFYLKQLFKASLTHKGQNVGLEQYPIRHNWKKIYLRKTALWENRFEALFKIR